MNNIVQLNELMNKKLFAILDIFLESSNQEYSSSEIRKKTKLSKATLAKWLSYLKKNNLLELRIIGRTNLYKTNNKFVIISYLKILNNLTKLLYITKLAEKYLCEIYIYGSVARGEDTEKSDIDLLIIADEHEKEILKDVNEYAKKIKREIKPQIFTKFEWMEMGKKDIAFYERVEKDKIKLT